MFFFALISQVTVPCMPGRGTYILNNQLAVEHTFFVWCKHLHSLVNRINRTRRVKHIYLAAVADIDASLNLRKY